MTPTPNQLFSAIIKEWKTRQASDTFFYDDEDPIPKLLDQLHTKNIELEERVARLENICTCPGGLPPNMAVTNCPKHGINSLEK